MTLAKADSMKILAFAASNSRTSINRAVINQHGFNLLWIGLATTIGAVFIWRGNMTAIWVAAMVGGLADVGYFLFMDLGGFVHFVPGTVMTLISASAILLSFWVWLAGRGTSAGITR